MTQGEYRPEPLSPADYDAQWSRLGDFVKYNPGAKHRRRLIRRLLKPISFESAVDVGCGTGEMLLLLASTNPTASLLGVDVAPGVITANRESIPFAEFAVHDLEDGPWGREFDLVICSEVIEHLSDWRVGLTHLSRMVKPGGTLIVTTPTGRVHATERAFGHVEHPTVDEMVDVASSCSLEVCEMASWGYPGYSLLKLIANLNPSWTMASFGSGRYGAFQRVVSSIGYLLGLISLPNSRRGCQIAASFRKD